MTREFDPDDEDTWPSVLTVGETKRIFRCHAASVYVMIGNGALRTVTVGTNGKRIPKAAVLEHLHPEVKAS